MERAIATSSDPHADLETLAAGPIVAGQDLTRTVDRWSIALALGGVLAVVPLVSYIVFSLGVSRSPAAAMMSVRALDNAGFHTGIDVMNLAIGLGLAAAALIGHACGRERVRLELPRWIQRLGHWIVVPLGFVLGLVVLIAALRAARDYQVHGVTASVWHMVALTIGSVTSTFLPAACGLLWWRRRENARLGL
jgi:hypothetical protein